MWTQFEFAASGGSVLPAGQEIRKLPFGEPAKPMTGKEPIAVKAGGILSGNFGRVAEVDHPAGIRVEQTLGCPVRR